jgi:hypothetical protein
MTSKKHNSYRQRSKQYAQFENVVDEVLQRFPVLLEHGPLVIEGFCDSLKRRLKQEARAADKMARLHDITPKGMQLLSRPSRMQIAKTRTIRKPKQEDH